MRIFLKNDPTRLLSRWLLRPLVALTFVAAAITPAAAQDAIYFPAVDNVAAQLVSRINAEGVRIDMSVARLNHRAISEARLGPCVRR